MNRLTEIEEQYDYFLEQLLSGAEITELDRDNIRVTFPTQGEQDE